MKAGNSCHLTCLSDHMTHLQLFVQFENAAPGLEILKVKWICVACTTVSSFKFECIVLSFVAIAHRSEDFFLLIAH